MTASHHAALQQSLSIRLNLQISLSALPIVEEWMDIHLTRWLESVPMPPEMPAGHAAHFSVRLASDLSRLTWGAYGDPAGFIPKMAGYLKSAKITKEDMSLIDEMGNGLEPALVGTWITACRGAVSTGWQFCDEHRFADISPLFADHEGKAKLLGWLSVSGVEVFSRFVQSIGEAPTSTIELPVPGVAVDDQLDAASQALTMLAGAPLPDAVREAMSSAVAPRLAVSVGLREGRITEASVIAPGLGNDVVAGMCQDMGLGFDDKLPRIQASFGADGPDRVMYTRVLEASAAANGGEPGAAAPRDQVDVMVIPTGAETRPPAESN